MSAIDQEQHIEPALAAFTEEERQEALSVITEDVVEGRPQHTRDWRHIALKI